MTSPAATMYLKNQKSTGCYPRDPSVCKHRVASRRYGAAGTSVQICGLRGSCWVSAAGHWMVAMPRAGPGSQNQSSFDPVGYFMAGAPLLVYRMLLPRAYGASEGTRSKRPPLGGGKGKGTVPRPGDPPVSGNRKGFFLWGKCGVTRSGIRIGWTFSSPGSRGPGRMQISRPLARESRAGWRFSRPLARENRAGRRSLSYPSRSVSYPFHISGPPTHALAFAVSGSSQ